MALQFSAREQDSCRLAHSHGCLGSTELRAGTPASPFLAHCLVVSPWAGPVPTHTGRVAGCKSNLDSWALCLLMGGCLFQAAAHPPPLPRSHLPSVRPLLGRGQDPGEHRAGGRAPWGTWLQPGSRPSAECGVFTCPFAPRMSSRCSLISGGLDQIHGKAVLPTRIISH